MSDATAWTPPSGHADIAPSRFTLLSGCRRSTRLVARSWRFAHAPHPPEPAVHWSSSRPRPNAPTTIRHICCSLRPSGRRRRIWRPIAGGGGELSLPLPCWRVPCARRDEVAAMTDIGHDNARFPAHAERTRRVIARSCGRWRGPLLGLPFATRRAARPAR